jgi:cysteine synthase A
LDVQVSVNGSAPRSSPISGHRRRRSTSPFAREKLAETSRNAFPAIRHRHADARSVAAPLAPSVPVAHYALPRERPETCERCSASREAVNRAAHEQKGAQIRACVHPTCLPTATFFVLYGVVFFHQATRRTTFTLRSTPVAKFNNILGTVGNTPSVKINRLAPEGVNVYVKIEAFNPLGSVKDRLALGIIEAAEKSGELKPGQTVVEATSGNTGIGLAMVCAAKGYPLVVTMAESFSIERRRLMRFLGAKVILTPPAERGTGMVKKALELAEKHGWFFTRQFENEANAEMHERTTAREIITDFAGERLDYWVTGFGTGGTLKGVSRVLKKERPETKIILCEPADAPMVSTHSKQERNPDGSAAKTNEAWKPHPIQGWSPDFIPKLTNDALEAHAVERVITVAGPDAMKASRELAQKEGIFVGISAGATFAAALEVAKGAEKGATILCMLPDTGERYLSTPLFADILADMSDAELEISKSTPAAQLPPKA